MHLQADTIAIEAADLYSTLPMTAAQVRVSKPAEGGGVIKMVGNRAPMGNTSRDPVRGAAGPYDYMAQQYTARDGSTTSVSAKMVFIANQLCQHVGSSNRLTMKMLHHGNDTAMASMPGYLGLGTIGGTPTTCMGISVAPPFYNRPHLDK
jgi:hypothetical protein